MHTALMLLKKIPKGKVTTYKELARVTRTSPRAIGMVMKTNPDPKGCPCYKVVKSSGEIGGYSGSGGIKRKIELLRKDGIIVNSGIVDKKYLWKFN